MSTVTRLRSSFCCTAHKLNHIHLNRVVDEQRLCFDQRFVCMSVCLCLCLLVSLPHTNSCCITEASRWSHTRSPVWILSESTRSEPQLPPLINIRSRTNVATIENFEVYCMYIPSKVLTLLILLSNQFLRRQPSIYLNMYSA